MGVDWVACEPWGFDFTAVNGRLSFEWDVPAEAVAAWVTHCMEHPDSLAADAYGDWQNGGFFVRRYIADGKMEHIAEADVVAAFRRRWVHTGTDYVRRPRWASAGRIRQTESETWPSR